MRHLNIHKVCSAVDRCKQCLTFYVLNKKVVHNLLVAANGCLQNEGECRFLRFSFVYFALAF